MKNVQNCLITLMLPIVFYSSSALAVFDENLNRACEKTSGSTIKVYPGRRILSDRQRISIIEVISVVRFLMLTVLIYINLVHAQQTRL